MVNYNGQLFPDGQPLFSPGNRAFRYGDALFESIRMFDGEMPFFDYHWERLIKGMEVLKINLPAHCSPLFFKKEIIKTVDNSNSKNCRVRLTVFRSGGGLYTPEKNGAEYLIEINDLGDDKFELNKKGLQVGIYDEFKISPSPISFFKSSNAVPFVLANIFKKENNWDNVILLNIHGRVACAGSSNVFLLKNNKLITPSIEEGCVEGVMRRTVMGLAGELKLTIEEKEIKINELNDAGEMFLTNAIQGVRWVQKIENIQNGFSNKVSKKIFAQLNNKIK